MFVAKFVGESLKPVRLLPDGQVLSLEILDQGYLRDALFIEVHLEARNFFKSRRF